MTLTQLRYIIALSRERHFGGAAGKSFVGEPTLSVAEKKLDCISETALALDSTDQCNTLGADILRGHVLVSCGSLVPNLCRWISDKQAVSRRRFEMFSIDTFWCAGARGDADRDISRAGAGLESGENHELVMKSSLPTAGSSPPQRAPCDAG